MCASMNAVSRSSTKCSHLGTGGNGRVGGGPGLGGKSDVPLNSGGDMVLGRWSVPFEQAVVECRAGKGGR